MVYQLKKLLRKGRLLVATAVLGFGIATGVAIVDSALPSQTNAASNCDKVNILYCGLGGSSLKGHISSIKSYYNNNKSGHKSSPSVKKDYTDVRKVFNYVGATTSEINSMNTSNSKLGTLYRNGNIYVGGNLVGTNAEVTARFSVSGAKKVPGTNVWLRKTTSSFANDKVPVVVYFKNGKMDFAVMVNCGNVVKAKPKVSTGICKELVRTIVNRDKRSVKATVKGSTTNAKIVDYKINWGDGKTSGKQSDTHTYGKYGKFTITGSVKVKYLNGNTAWVSSSKCKSTVEFTKPKPPQALKCVDLKAASTGKKNEYRFTAKGSKANGATIQSYTFRYDDGKSDTVRTTGTSATARHTFTKTGSFTATVHVNGKLNGKSVSVTDADCKAKVTIVPPKQALKCVELKATPVQFLPRDGEGETNAKNSQYRFTAKADPDNGATIKSYTFDFGDSSDKKTVDSSSTTATTIYNYDKVGEYTATVDVTGVVNGKTVTVTAPACKVKITITPDEKLVCVNLTKEESQDIKNQFVFRAIADALNGATITGYTFDFGDGSDTVSVTSSSKEAEATHKYTADGTYTAKVRVNGTVNGKALSVSNAECEVEVKVETPPEECKPGVPVNSPECEDEFCPIPGKEHLPVDSPECEDEEEPELPETGAAGMLALFGGTSALGTLGHRLYIKRRTRR